MIKMRDVKDAKCQLGDEHFRTMMLDVCQMSRMNWWYT